MTADTTMSIDSFTEHCIRPLVRRLGLPPEAWSRADLVRYALEAGVRCVNFRYPSLDGKLRELRLPVNDRDYLERILAAGERVDGSSLFPGLFPTGASDLYAVPVYRWAFANPWAEDELDIVCRFVGPDGAPSADTPDNLLATAARRFRETTGGELLALAELEFYLILDREDDRFSGKAQRSYHQSAPYLHGRPIADDILRKVSAVTGAVKYCHSEVGYIDRIESAEPELDGRRVEQYEIEFDLLPIEDLGCWLTVARWLVREIAARHGASVTFVPKLDQGMAGSGLHLHLAVERDGVNTMRQRSGELSEDALGVVGGILHNASPLTAFGNTVSASFLRLVPGQEAPTRICWGRRNRATLMRVPLDFAAERRLDRAVNPGEPGDYPADLSRPTVEYRGPDGSAFNHLLLAAVAGCAEKGMSDPALRERALAMEVGADTSAEELARLEQLPGSAVAAARSLREHRPLFEEGGMSPRLIDYVIGRLETEADEDLAARLAELPAAERLTEARRLMHKDLHKH